MPFSGMLVLGILGGVASGKSLVAEQLESLGACRVDADRIGHEVLREPEVLAALRSHWGDSILAADGQIDRRAVGAIVFAPPPRGPEELRYLEQVTHPRIGERLRSEFERLARGGTQVAVLDAAVMVKAGWHKFCDRIVFVDVDRSKRLARALQRGWSATEFAARESSQESLEQKKQIANVVIDNSGSPAETLAQVRDFWMSLPLSR